MKSFPSRPFSPFGDFDETDYNIILEFYAQKWKQIILERAYYSYDKKVDRASIFAELLLP